MTNDNNTITEYSLPDGTPGPTIAGSNTTMAGPLGISVDSSGNIFVVNTGTGGNQVLEFAAGASGNAAPIAAIAGPATTLNVAQFVYIASCGTIPPASKAPDDFNGDGKTDIAVFRPSTGTWYINNSGTTSPTVTAWGTSGDTPIGEPPGS